MSKKVGYTPSTRDQCIAAMTAFIDAILGAIAPQPTPVPTPTPTPTPVPVPVPVPVPMPIPSTTGHPRIMLNSQLARLKTALTTPVGVRWIGACDSWVSGGDLWGFDAWNGALASQLTGNPKYGIKAISIIDAQVSAAESAIAAGSAPEVAGDSYLQIGDMIGDLALVYDWCSSTLTATQRSRWIAYANQAVSNVWNYETAKWGGKLMPWTGWATDDPGDNYYYSFLRATMLLGLATQGDNTQSQTWLDKFRERLVGRLVPYMTQEQSDGGSREGTGYGVALRNLFECYLLWQWSTGERLADLTPHTRATLLTAASQVVPMLDHKAPIGDQSRDSTAALFDYERDLFEILLELYPNVPEAAGVTALLAQSSISSMQNGFMLGVDFEDSPPPAPATINLPLVRYATGIGEINARTSWSKTATWLHVKAGPYTQSHAHQDQGSLMLYKGTWLVPDSVLWSKGGVAQSTSPVGTVLAHSLVRVTNGANPIGQVYGSISQVTALHAGPGYIFAALDLSAAYKGTVVSLMRRQVLWLQPDVVVIQDRVISPVLASQTWQLVVPTAPVISGGVATVTTGGHNLTVTRVAPATGTWVATSFKALNSDFTDGWRLDQTQPGGDRTFVTIISIDGATSSAASTVQFSDIGCTFMLNNNQITLAAGIDPV